MFSKEESDLESVAPMPEHVAIIMDGNGRWARKRRLPRVAGHKAGVESVRAVVQGCVRRGISALTLFAFSSENWKRPKQEVGFLMDLFLRALEREVRSLHENNVRVRVIGDITPFSQKLQAKINEAHALTADNTGLALNIAANYGGRWDIVHATRQMCMDVQHNKLQVDDINETLLRSYLQLSDLPDPDLFIRTGGEQRISNYLLWNLAYTELFFTDVSWPDFDEQAFADAISSFQSRERRFGKTSEQVKSGA